MVDSEPEFVRLQRAFTAHVRNPDLNPAPAGIEERRLGIYRELLYNNIESFMAASFPVLRSILPDENWHSLIRGYFAGHVARTPLFPKLPQEFLHYLAAAKPAFAAPAFLQELAHYEWLELEVQLDKREIGDIEPGGDANCLDGIPVINPIARVHAYTYPVHRLSPEFQPSEPPHEPTYLAVYRDRDDEVGFMELNPITARLVELILHEPGRSGHDLLEQIAAELQHPDPSVVVAGGTQILEELTLRGVILGAR